MYRWPLHRAEITLNDFDLQKNTVLIDLASLLNDSDVDKNQENSPSGCMSAPDDGDCKAIFNNLGLDFGDSKASRQKFFKVG